MPVYVRTEKFGALVTSLISSQQSSVEARDRSVRKRIITLTVALGAALGALLGLTAEAEPYPTRAIKIIVPSLPGGAYDRIARIAARELAGSLGQQVVVENRTGAGTVVGTDAAAKAPADGYTLLLGGLSNIAVNVGLYRHLPYDPATDFVAIGIISTVPYALMGRKDLPQSSLRELIDYAKANPGILTYASSGVGSGPHIAAAALLQGAGVNMVHVAYRGASPAYADLLAGRVDLFFDSAGTAAPYIESKRLKGLAISGAARLPALSQLPTVRETGVADAVVEGWYGLFGPSKMPKGIVDKLRAEVAKMVRTPAAVELLERNGDHVVRMTPSQTEAYVSSEIAKWSKLVRDAGIKAD